MKRAGNFGLLALIAIGLASGCWFDDTLREYLDARFWLPFAKTGRHFENRGVRRVNFAFAGMTKAAGASPLDKVRKAYQEIAAPVDVPYDPTKELAAVAAARTGSGLSARDREEVDLIEAKMLMRSGTPVEPARLREAQAKLERFVKSAKAPEFLSEARGWLAHIHYRMGERTIAGKMYLDELNRPGSNLSRETLLTSLQMNYGYNGRADLYDHIGEYFDTPEHAAFAVEIATNPHWERGWGGWDGTDRLKKAEVRDDRDWYGKIHAQLLAHRELFQSAKGAAMLTALSMRTSLAMGDPAGALKIAEMVAAGDAVRSEPDFLWMLASSHYLTHDFAGAEQPLLELFQARRASIDEKAAAAYGLCGVYEKTSNTVEQIRYALWLRDAAKKNGEGFASSSQSDDLGVYWAASGWDLGMLLDWEAPMGSLQAFIQEYPAVANVRLVKYALAVRLARENRYEESAAMYESIHAVRRAPRMRELAKLYADASHQGRLKLAEFLLAHDVGIYFNDTLWGRVQRYAMFAEDDYRFTREERDRETVGERKLKDDQDERWRAYLIARDVATAEGKTELGRKAARFAIKCVRGFGDRFGREEDRREGELELSKLLRP